MSSEILKAETVESGVLWDVAPGIVLEIAGVTEEHAASFTKADLRKDDSPVEIRWHTVTHGRGSEAETGEWSG